MKISVIIPAYNVEQYLREAVASAFETLYANMEVVVVADKSTDRTRDVAVDIQREYGDSVKLLNNEAGAPSAAVSRNIGINASDGEIIAFLDADDWYLPNRFDQAPEIIEKYCDVDGVYELSDVATDRNKTCMDMQNRKTARLLSNSMYRTTIRGALREPWNTNTITLRRRVFERVGLFNERLDIGEDTEMWIRIVGLTNVVAGTCDEPVAVYYRHPGNRYKRSFDRNPQARVGLWVQAFKAIKRIDVNAACLVDLKTCIVGKVVYKSDELRKAGDVRGSMYYLGKMVEKMPSLLLEGRFIREYLVALRDGVKLLTRKVRSMLVRFPE